MLRRPPFLIPAKLFRAWSTSRDLNPTLSLTKRLHRHQCFWCRSPRLSGVSIILGQNDAQLVQVSDTLLRFDRNGDCRKTIIKSPSYALEHRAGIEPVSSAWEADMLPLHQRCRWGSAKPRPMINGGFRFTRFSRIALRRRNIDGEHLAGNVCLYSLLL